MLYNLGHVKEVPVQFYRYEFFPGAFFNSYPLCFFCHMVVRYSNFINILKYREVEFYFVEMLKKRKVYKVWMC